MAASHTPKKFQNKKKKPVTAQQVNTVTDLVTGYVKHWAKEEAQRLLHTEKVPIIVPTKTGYKVGKFTLTKQPADYWVVTDINGERPIDFAEKQSAVLYCISYQLNKFTTAHDILTKDQAFAKLNTDYMYYEHCIRQAVKRQDMFTVDMLRARSHDTKCKLDYARNELQKSLNQAKYIKIWDNRK
jgi:hypothetical protein